MTGTTDRSYLADKTYLVTFDTSLDNVPVRLFKSLSAAVQYVLDHPPYHPDGEDAAKAPPDVKAACNVARYGLADTMGYSIWTLEDAGPPTKVDNRYYWPTSVGDVNPWPYADKGC